VHFDLMDRRFQLDSWIDNADASQNGAAGFWSLNGGDLRGEATMGEDLLFPIFCGGAVQAKINHATRG
jgi:hypothetical protein